MARQITKELALRIVAKLGARPSADQRSGAAHDLYDVVLDGVRVTTLSIRRGSSRDLGHDFLPRQLRLGPNQAKRLGQCSISVEQSIAILREQGVLPPVEPVAEDEPTEPEPPEC